MQKFLAEAGFGSRRQCEDYIRSGRVTIDGTDVCELGETVDPDHQTVHLDGELVKRQPKRYYLLNKPAGCLCTHRDPAGRVRAIDLVPDDVDGLFTVGRLDENSQGLLLVTNDGDLGNRLAHPRYQVPRRYRVQVAGRPNRKTLRTMEQGLHFAEGKFRARQVKLKGTQGQSSFLELVLTEGRNREIRRMLARLGHKVLKLERTGFGPLRLGRLPVGRFRPLKPDELKSLRDVVQKPANKRRRKQRSAKK